MFSPLERAVNRFKIRMIHYWGGVLPGETRNADVVEIKTIVHAGPHLHFTDMRQALAEDIAHQMLVKGLVKIDRAENESGTRFEATAKVVWAG